MRSTSETGHAKNVANFEQLALSCTSLGAAYNPVNRVLSVGSISAASQEASQIMASVLSARAVLSGAVTERNSAFEPLSGLTTRIGNAVKSSGCAQQTIGQVVSIIRKIQGRRATPRVSEEEQQAAVGEGTEIITRSSSQMSFTSRIENFDALIRLLETISEYTPNETDLTLVSLQALHLDLKTKNIAVLNAEIALDNLRSQRDDLLYSKTTGIVDKAFAVKAYIKSVFGATSTQYKQVSSLRFTRPQTKP